MYSSATIRTIARYRDYAQTDANPDSLAVFQWDTLHGTTLTTCQGRWRAVAMMAKRNYAARCAAAHRGGGRTATPTSGTDERGTAAFTRAILAARDDARALALQMRQCEDSYRTARAVILDYGFRVPQRMPNTAWKTRGVVKAMRAMRYAATAEGN